MKRFATVEIPGIPLLAALVAAFVALAVCVSCAAGGGNAGAGNAGAGSAGAGNAGSASAQASTQASVASASAQASAASAPATAPGNAAGTATGGSQTSIAREPDASMPDRTIGGSSGPAAVGDAGQQAFANATPLIIDGDPAIYTYEDLASDVKALASRYPQWVTLDSLGTTADGRSLYHMVIGNPRAANKVLIHGGIHAREYLTVQLVMKQAAAFLSHAAADDAYGSARYADLLNANAIHVIPNVNPDGVALSQQGIDAMKTDAVRQRVIDIAASDGAQPSADYFRSWKANANGVDLNRNFDALWDSYGGAGQPSSEMYKGQAPGCEVESAALIALTQKERFARTISYHAQGSLVYWYFGQEGTLLDDTQHFAHVVSDATGYATYADYENLDPAGYKDWAIQTMGIPSLTIEVGLGEVPLPADQFPAIWQQNEHVWEVTLTQ